MALPAPPYQSPAWYPDPEDSGRNRWWNGISWTDQYQTDATGPTPAAATGPAEKLAQAKAMIASMPEFAGKPLPTVASANLAVTRLVSYSLGFGAAAIILAVANLGDPFVFGIVAVVLGLIAYGVALLSVRLHMLRTRTNRILAFLGTIFASCAICLVIATTVLGWHVDFSNHGSASIGQNAGGGSAADDAQTHAAEQAVLVKLTTAWEGPHSRIGTWPSSAGTENGMIVSSYGNSGIRLPTGWRFTYTPTSDLLGYTATVVDGDGIGEMFDQEHGLYEPTS